MYRQVGIFSSGSTRSSLEKNGNFGQVSMSVGVEEAPVGLLTWDIIWIGSEKLGFWLFKLVSIISRVFSRHYGALFAAWTEIRTENFFSKNHFFDCVLENFSKIDFRRKIENFQIFTN